MGRDKTLCPVRLIVKGEPTCMTTWGACRDDCEGYPEYTPANREPRPEARVDCTFTQTQGNGHGYWTYTHTRRLGFEVTVEPPYVALAPMACDCRDWTVTRWRVSVGDKGELHYTPTHEHHICGSTAARGVADRLCSSHHGFGPKPTPTLHQDCKRDALV